LALTIKVLKSKKLKLEGGNKSKGFLFYLKASSADCSSFLGASFLAASFLGASFLVASFLGASDLGVSLEP